MWRFLDSFERKVSIIVDRKYINYEEDIIIYDDASTFKLNVGLLCFLKLLGAPGYLKISLTIQSLSFLMGFNNF